MGNCMSRCFTSNQCCSWYPKNKWLKPTNILSVATITCLAIEAQRKTGLSVSPTTDLKFFLSISTLMGSQFWNIFIGEPSLLFSLPRQQLSAIEQKLYPKLRIVGLVLSGVGAVYFLQRYPFSAWSGQTKTLGWTLLTSFALNVFNATCFGEQTFKIFDRMVEIEKKAGVDEKSVAFVPPNPTLEADDTYKNLRCRFNLVHSLAAIANLGSLGCNIATFYLLSKNNSLSF